MDENEDPIYRIHFSDNKDYSLAICGENVVLALTHPFDRSQHWIKKLSATIKDSDGQPRKHSDGQLEFALINRATGQAISHRPNSQPLSLVRYKGNSCDESVLWTMSEEYNGSRTIRRWDDIYVCFKSEWSFVRYDGQLIYSARGYWNHCNWKFEKVSLFTFISLFKPSQHTVKIICQKEVGYNLAIDKDGSTVRLVPSNPKDRYQHWIKEMAYGVPVKDEEEQEAFALVNKATGKAIKHGFGEGHFVQVAPFNRNYMDPSLLWTNSKDMSDGFKKIRTLNDVYLGFGITGTIPLLVLSSTFHSTSSKWKIEDFE